MNVLCPIFFSKHKTNTGTESAAELNWALKSLSVDARQKQNWASFLGYLLGRTNCRTLSFFPLNKLNCRRAGVLRSSCIFIYLKLLFFACSIRCVWLGVGYFNRPGPEIGYFYSQIDLEVTFGTTPQNRKPQMSSFVHCTLTPPLGHPLGCFQSPSKLLSTQLFAALPPAKRVRVCTAACRFLNFCQHCFNPRMSRRGDGFFLFLIRWKL